MPQDKSKIVTGRLNQRLKLLTVSLGVIAYLSLVFNNGISKCITQD